MYQPHAHHVLIFLGTFLALWSISLIARGLLHRPRVGPPPARGPRKVKKAAVAAGAFGFPIGVAVVAAGFYLRSWIYGPDADPSGLSVYHALAAGIVAFAIALGTWGLFADRAKRTLRCPKCWYDMASVASTGRHTCPECGHDAKSTHNLQRTRRHWKLVTLAAFIAFAGLLAPRFANLSKGGIKSVLPTTVMIAAYWQLPDEWLTRTKSDDEWAMDGRLDERNSWAWQRAWHTSKMRSEIRSPTGLARLTHALSHESLVSAVKDGDFRTDTYVFVARHLGATDPQIRLQAFELHRRGVGMYAAGQGMYEEVEDIKKRAAPQIVEHADEIARGLADTNTALVLETCWVLLSAKTHHSEVANAVLALYPTLFRTEDIMSTTIVLFAAGERDDRVIDAVLNRADDSNDFVARSVWSAMAIQSVQTALPPQLLERIDRELRERTDNERFTSAAIIRLSEANFDQTLEDSLLSIASTPGEKRAAALRAFKYYDTYSKTARREHLSKPLLNAAFSDQDFEVLKVALDWVYALAMNKREGYGLFLANVEPLTNHSDVSVQAVASQVKAMIRNNITAEQSDSPEPASR